MNVLSTDLRAIIERVTEIELELPTTKGTVTHRRVYVFEQLGRDGTPCGSRIQNWECDDITNDLSSREREEIFEAVNKHWKNK